MIRKRITSERLLPILVNLVLIILFLSCSDTGENSKAVQIINTKQDSIKRKPPSSFSDTIAIDFPAAVFYSPDSLQLEKIRAVTDSGIFESVMHDCFYQMSYSRNVLKKNWPNSKMVEVRNARFLLFRSADGSKEYADLDTRNDACGIFLFNGRKKAQLVDMTNFDSEAGFYFRD